MRKYVLVVDDDAVFRTLLKVRLRSTGYTVDTARDWLGRSDESGARRR